MEVTPIPEVPPVPVLISLIYDDFFDTVGGMSYLDLDTGTVESIILTGGKLNILMELKIG